MCQALVHVTYADLLIPYKPLGDIVDYNLFTDEGN